MCLGKLAEFDKVELIFLQKGKNMKRKALIIGCSGDEKEYLPGVKKDVSNYTKFLSNGIGGQWYESEIISLLDASNGSITEAIRTIKMQNNDFVFIVFSGHGDYSTAHRCRRLHTNKGQYILEKELWGIAKKELLIIDSCAGKVNDIKVTTVALNAMALDEKLGIYKKNYRKEYETSIEQCLNQEIYLYACDINEFSSDTSKGGLFSKNILEAAYNNRRFDVLNSLVAHEIASDNVSRESRNKQNPQYICTVRQGSKLPFSLKV